MPTNNAWNSQNPVQVQKGGTGLNTVAQGDLLFGSAPNTLSRLPKETLPKRYLSNSGTNNDPAYSQVDLSGGVTGVLPVTNGGTGLNTVAQGDILIASASNTLITLPKDTNATRYLSNTGTNNAPAYAQVDLSNGVTSTLPVSNGGSGVNSTTAFGILAGGTTSTSAFQNCGTGSAGEVLTSNGAGVLPSFQASGGATTVLSSQSLVGVNSVTFNNFVNTSKYMGYKLFMYGVNQGGGPGIESIELQISTDNGSTFINTGYYWRNIGGVLQSNVSAFAVGSQHSTYMTNLELSLWPFGEALTTKGISMISASDSVQLLRNFYNDTTSANAFKIYFPPGTNWDSGRATLYGYNK